jgi:hypothetical protein
MKIGKQGSEKKHLTGKPWRAARVACLLCSAVRTEILKISVSDLRARRVIRVRSCYRTGGLTIV